MKGTQELAKKLLDQMYSTSQLKQTSAALEKLSQTKSFKIHTNEIINDNTLTDSQKKNQLLYVVKSIDIPVLYDFFSDQLSDNSFWLFSSGQLDYFDRFVQSFQKSIQEVKVIKIVTAIDLDGNDLRAIAKNLSKWFDERVVLQHEVNAGIIGGLQIQIENMVFDNSLRTKFRHFTREWLKSVVDTHSAIGF